MESGSTRVTGRGIAAALPTIIAGIATTTGIFGSATTTGITTGADTRLPSVD
jgi:hypothetical protein